MILRFFIAPFTGIFFLLLTTICAFAQGPRSVPRDATYDWNAPIQKQVDEVLKGLSLREKIGQLFFTIAYGSFESEESPEFKRLERRIKEDHIGGLMFSRGDVYGQAILTNKLQRMTRIPLWITQDMEYGAAMRIRGATRFTPAMGIAATGNPEYAYQVGRITAKEARAMGVHQIFAPVVDINNNPSNPIINVRSFSEDPRTVEVFADAFMRGAASQRVLTTAKHFPGHGDTEIDSHIALPVIRHSYDRLDSLELRPFKTLIKSGLPSVMSAHISFPGLSNDPNVPGTLDESILKRILIDSLGFKGIVFTDGLEMKGVSDLYSPGKAVVMALKAGADLMLLSPDERTAIDEIEAAVRNGEITEQRIDESVRKLLYWKINYGLFQSSTVNVEALSKSISTNEHALIAKEIARNSITLLKNERNILPISTKRFPKVMILAIADDESGSTGSTFARGVRQFHPDVTFHIYDKRTSRDDMDNIVNSARKADLILVGSFIYVQTASKINFSPTQQRFLSRIFELKKPMAVVSFGSPYIFSSFTSAQVHVAAWSADVTHMQETAPALFGATEIRGRLPISIPKMYDQGSGIDIKKTINRPDAPEVVKMHPDTLTGIDRIIEQGIRDKVFPGAVALVLKDGIVAYHKTFGYHDYDKKKPVKTTDMYDLASLTKVVATTAAIMKLHEEKKISLDDKVIKHLPKWTVDKKGDVTIRQLLTHTSGLPAFRVYVDSLKTREAILNAIYKEPLINAPGKRMVYSDLGFILLGEIIEKVSGQRLDQYVQQQIFAPLGMSSTMFNPHRRGRWMINRIPPTEIDTVYGRGLVQANVNDERAFFMDGYAGHAGIFGTAEDLAIFAQLIINKGTYGDVKLYSPETVELFTKRGKWDQTRALGFDLKATKGFTAAGQKTSKDTFGHLGFTGTSFWIDPDRKTAIILLTNRTFPSRENGSKIGKIRSDVADKAIESILK